MEVSLMEMLDARERRAQRQMQLLQQYGRPLICFTMNIAGPIKNSPLIHRGFLMGKRLLEQQLMAAKAKILHFEEICEKTGNEAIYVLDCDPMTAKQAAVIIEDHTEAGRLFDMDVLRPDGSKVDRQEQNLGARTCLICGGIAQNCARSRTHTVAQLQERTQELLETALTRYEARETARLACQALLYEVAATPKPGLVDRANSGSHRDMDFFTFQASAAALWPYFETCARIGMETRDLAPEETFSRLRAPGMVAEGEMLRATGGVNTHKGAIFSLGILCAALGRMGWEYADKPQWLLYECSQMTAGLVAKDFAGLTPETAKTAGQKLYLRHGITVIDALYWVVNKIKEDKALNGELQALLAQAGYDVNRLADGKKLVLITGHRRENFGDGFINMCKAIKDLTLKYPDVDFVYPMHLNPNVRKPIAEVFGSQVGANMFFIEPLEYLSFVYLMEKSTIVLTDSGGIQEEAPGLGKPVLVMRDTTERPEALEAGTVKLVGTNYDKIVTEVSALLDDQTHYNTMSKAVNPYGDGLACGRIVDTLK